MDTRKSAPRARVLAALAIGALAISFSAIFFRLAGDVHPVLLAGARLAISAALLSPFTWRAWRRGALTPRVRRAGLAAGLLYGAHFGTWVASLQLTSVASSVSIVTATPVILALVGLARRRDAPSARQLAGIALALAGLTTLGVADSGADSHLAGDALALAGAIAMAGYLLVARELGDELDPFVLTGLATLGGAIVLALVAALVTASGGDLGNMSASSLSWVALSALVPQLIGHTSLTWALRSASPTAVGLATTAEPVMSTALAVVLLSEVPPAIVALGGAITITGVIVGLSDQRRRP